MNKKELLILLVIFLSTVILRITLAYHYPDFAIQESYTFLREAEYFQESLQPMTFDDLSFAGREKISSPLFGILIGLFGAIFPIAIIGKVLLNIMAASVIIISFLVTKQMTKDSYVSLLAAFVAGFVPVFFSYTFNRITMYAFTLPLFLLLMYLFLNIKKKRFIYLYILTLVYYSFLSPTISVFVIGLIFYFILLKVGKMDILKVEWEVAFFSIFFVLWSQLLLYKKVLLAHGPLVIWQNLPKEVLTNYFADITLLEAVYLIGELPFLFGLFIIFKNLFRDKNREMHFLIAFALSTGLLLWLRLLPITMGLMFFGFILVLLFGIYYKVYLNYLEKTRVSRFIPVLKISFILVFLLTSVYPSVVLSQDIDVASADEQIVLHWLHENTDDDRAIFASIEQGDLITAISKRKTLIDQHFLGVHDANQRYEDYRTIATTPSKTQALTLLDTYKIKHLWFSPRIAKEFDLDNFPFIDNDCFPVVLSIGQHEVRKVSCDIEQL